MKNAVDDTLRNQYGHVSLFALAEAWLIGAAEERGSKSPWSRFFHRQRLDKLLEGIEVLLENV